MLKSWVDLAIQLFTLWPLICSRNSLKAKSNLIQKVSLRRMIWKMPITKGTDLLMAFSGLSPQTKEPVPGIGPTTSLAGTQTKSLQRKTDTITAPEKWQETSWGESSNNKKLVGGSAALAPAAVDQLCSAVWWASGGGVHLSSSCSATLQLPANCLEKQKTTLPLYLVTKICKRHLM